MALRLEGSARAPRHGDISREHFRRECQLPVWKRRARGRLVDAAGLRRAHEEGPHGERSVVVPCQSHRGARPQAQPVARGLHSGVRFDLVLASVSTSIRRPFRSRFDVRFDLV